MEDRPATLPVLHLCRSTTRSCSAQWHEYLSNAPRVARASSWHRQDHVKSCKNYDAVPHGEAHKVPRAKSPSLLAPSSSMQPAPRNTLIPKLIYSASPAYSTCFQHHSLVTPFLRASILHPKFPNPTIQLIHLRKDTSALSLGRPSPKRQRSTCARLERQATTPTVSSLCGPTMTPDTPDRWTPAGLVRRVPRRLVGGTWDGAFGGGRRGAFFGVGVGSDLTLTADGFWKVSGW